MELLFAITVPGVRMLEAFKMPVLRITSKGTDDIATACGKGRSFYVDSQR
jgi:hypothetical protein